MMAASLADAHDVEKRLIELLEIIKYAPIEVIGSQRNIPVFGFVIHTMLEALSGHVSCHTKSESNNSLKKKFDGSACVKIKCLEIIKTVLEAYPVSSFICSVLPGVMSALIPALSASKHQSKSDVSKLILKCMTIGVSRARHRIDEDAKLPMVIQAVCPIILSFDSNDVLEMSIDFLAELLVAIPNSRFLVPPTDPSVFIDTLCEEGSKFIGEIPVETCTTDTTEMSRNSKFNEKNGHDQLVEAISQIISKIPFQSVHTVVTKHRHLNLMMAHLIPHYKIILQSSYNILYQKLPSTYHLVSLINMICGILILDGIQPSMFTYNLELVTDTINCVSSLIMYKFKVSSSVADLNYDSFQNICAPIDSLDQLSMWGWQSSEVGLAITRLMSNIDHYDPYLHNAMIRTILSNFNKIRGNSPSESSNGDNHSLNIDLPTGNDPMDKITVSKDLAILSLLIRFRKNEIKEIEQIVDLLVSIIDEETDCASLMMSWCSCVASLLLSSDSYECIEYLSIPLLSLMSVPHLHVCEASRYLLVEIASIKLPKVSEKKLANYLIDRQEVFVDQIITQMRHPTIFPRTPLALMRLLDEISTLYAQKNSSYMPVGLSFGGLVSLLSDGVAVMVENASDYQRYPGYVIILLDAMRSVCNLLSKISTSNNAEKAFVLLESIVRLVVHFITADESRVRLVAIRTIDASISLFPEWNETVADDQQESVCEDQNSGKKKESNLLQLVHLTWKPLVGRILYDSISSVSVAALGVVSTQARLCKSFMRDRLEKDIFSQTEMILQRHIENPNIIPLLIDLVEFTCGKKFTCGSSRTIQRMVRAVMAALDRPYLNHDNLISTCQTDSVIEKGFYREENAIKVLQMLAQIDADQVWFVLVVQMSEIQVIGGHNLAPFKIQKPSAIQSSVIDSYLKIHKDICV